VLNRLTQVDDPDSGTTLYDYDNVGNLNTVTYENGTVADYDYDDLNRLTLITQTIGPDTYTYAYTLGPAGNRTRLVETLPGPTVTSRTVDWAYDDLYRLTKETIKEEGDTKQITEYDYDDVGNRLSKTLIVGNNRYDTMYAYDDMDRLLTESTTTTVLADAVAGPDEFWLAANPRRALRVHRVVRSGAGGRDGRLNECERFLTGAALIGDRSLALAALIWDRSLALAALIGNKSMNAGKKRGHH